MDCTTWWFPGVSCWAFLCTLSLLSKNSDSLTSLSIWTPLIPFSCLIVMARTSSTVFDSKCDSGQPCLVPNLRGNAESQTPTRSFCVSICSRARMPGTSLHSEFDMHCHGGWRQRPVHHRPFFAHTLKSPAPHRSHIVATFIGWDPELKFLCREKPDQLIMFEVNSKFVFRGGWVCLLHVLGPMKESSGTVSVTTALCSHCRHPPS